MKFSDYLIETGVNPSMPITESYVMDVADRIDFAELAKVFAGFGKLTGRINEDTAYLRKFATLLEKEDFDPFGYLQKTDKIEVSKDCVLTLSGGNVKLSKMGTVSLALPAGYTCPFAKVCKSVAHKKGGKFKDGKSIKDYGDIRCYAASAEAQYPAVREKRWRNFDLLRQQGSTEGMAKLILRSIDYFESTEKTIRTFRIHDSGDFFSQEYFDAWILAAERRSDILFYAYTKALPLWQARKGDIPKNLRLIASEGGTHDEIIDKEGFRRAVIATDMGQAIEKRLHVDLNDFLAAFGDGDFALLLHGTQSKESGKGSQSRKNNQVLKAAAAKMKGVSADDISKLMADYITSKPKAGEKPIPFRKFANTTVPSKKPAKQQPAGNKEAEVLDKVRNATQLSNAT